MTLPKKDRSKYKQITINITPFEAKQFKILREKGLSARRVLEYSGCPCDKCKGITVFALNNEGEQVLIPKGILSSK